MYIKKGTDCPKLFLKQNKPYKLLALWIDFTLCFLYQN